MQVSKGKFVSVLN